MEIYEKIDKIIKDKGLKKKDIAKKLIDWDVRLKSTGEVVSEKAVYTYLNGNREIKVELLPYFAEALGVTPVDIFPDTNKYRIKIAKDELEKQRIVKTVPLINGYIGAGSFGLNESNEPIDKIYVDIHTIEKAYRNKELQAIRVAGDSMMPYINDGDIALFCKFKDGEAPNGDGKYIISTSQGEQIKNLKFMLNGNIRIISENPSYHTKDGYDEEINKESQEYLKIIGKVVGRILKG